MAAIREVEANCSTSIMEAEGGHVTAIREVEAACMACTFDLQQAHRGTIWTLESETIDEDGQAWQSFLWACGAALQACPAEALEYPIQLLTGNMSLTSLLMAVPQQTINPRGPIPSPSHSKSPTVVAYSAGTQWSHSLPGCNTELDQSRDEPISCPKELPL